MHTTLVKATPKLQLEHQSEIAALTTVGSVAPNSVSRAARGILGKKPKVAATSTSKAKMQVLNGQGQPLATPTATSTLAVATTRSSGHRSVVGRTPGSRAQTDVHRTPWALSCPKEIGRLGATTSMASYRSSRARQAEGDPGHTQRYFRETRLKGEEVVIVVEQPTRQEGAPTREERRSKARSTNRGSRCRQTERAPRHPRHDPGHRRSDGRETALNELEVLIAGEETTHMVGAPTREALGMKAKASEWGSRSLQT